MSDKLNPNKGELVLSSTRSLPTKRSCLVKRGLQLTHELKRRQIRVLIGDMQDNIAETIIVPFLESEIRDRHDLTFMCTSYGGKILELAQDHVFDIFILILNNIWFPNITRDKHLRKSLETMSHLRATYGKPVIALTSISFLQPDSSLYVPGFAEKARLAGASFFFPMPFKLEDFKEAIEKCLDSLPEVDERR